MENANCGKCPVVNQSKKYCISEDGRAPSFCPTQKYENSASEIKSMIEAEGDLDFYLNSLKLVGGKVTRVEETVNFARGMGYKKIGLAFCMSVRKEAEVLTAILQTAGFEVVSSVCKVGRCKLSDFEDSKAETKGVVWKPVLQAKVLNDAEVEYNVVFGLCVGHDSLFMKYAEAMSTVLVAKDRLMGHNPMAAIYTADTFHSELKNLKPKEQE